MRKFLVLGIGLMAAFPLFARKSYGEWVNYSQTVMSITILALIAVVGGLALRWAYKNNYKGKLSFGRYAIQNPLVRLGFGLMLVVLVVNVVVGDRSENTAAFQASIAKQRQMPHLAEKAFRDLSRAEPRNLSYHYEYITAYYQQEQWASENGEVDIPDPDDVRPVEVYYRMSMDSSDAYLQDVGRLGLGMIEYYQRSNGAALTQLHAVKDQRMAYRNLYLGKVYLRQLQLDSAEQYLRREIAIGAIPDLAVPELATMIYIAQPDSTAKLLSLLQDPGIGQHVPLVYERYVYTKQAALVDYLAAVMHDWWIHIQWIGLLGAILGTLVWMLFLRRVDAMRQTAWLPLVTVFIGGAFFAFVALILYDFVEWEWGFSLSRDGAIGHDFLYCVLGIGVIEELVKILPFLLLLQFTKRAATPISYLIYASMSALGFAFVENVMYFDAGHLGIMHGRVLICNVFHMFATSTIAFGMVLGRYKFGKLQWPFFFLFFALAALMHGFYDFWLISEQVSLLVFMAYVLFIYATFQYASYLNNALNQSPTFKDKALLDPRRLAVFLTVGLVGILLFEYFGLSIAYGATLGNFALVKSLGMGSFLMFFVVLNLSNIDMVQGEWFWLRLWNFGTREVHNALIGQRLRLLPKLPTGPMAAMLPLDGEVISRVTLFGSSQYFLFQLSAPPVIAGRALEFVLLRAKKDGEALVPDHAVEAAVIVFKDKESLSRRDKRKEDFRTLDTVIIA